MSQTSMYFSANGEIFEDSGISNGGFFWLATRLSEMLGYASYGTFKRAISRAQQTCTTLDISIADNFAEVKGPTGKTVDFKLTRFACYLVSMNADNRKPEVASAQAYFAGLAEAVQKYIQDSSDVERVQIRDELADHTKSLHGTAQRAGVTEFGLFHNAGYRGMYNMNLSQLKARKGFTGRGTLFDFMGKRELAGNLFRITETEAKLETKGFVGQRAAETVAEGVGRKVRKMMIDNTGETPESLPLAGDVKKVKTDLKSTERAFGKRDSKRRLRPGES
jgi:DNA-damage-inducible protein D